MNSCVVCGQALPAGVRYCPRCGVPILWDTTSDEADDPVEEIVAEETVVESAPSAEMPQDGTVVELAPTGEAIEHKPKQKASPVKWIALIAAVVLLLGAVGATAWYMLLLPPPVEEAEQPQAFVSPYALYYKNKTLMLYNSQSGDTQTLFPSSAASYDQLTLSADGKRLFFMRRVHSYVSSLTGSSLYYQALDDLEAEPVLIASSTLQYTVNAAGDCVVYVNGNQELFYYDMQQSVKIDRLSTDLSDIYYVYYDRLYVHTDGRSMYYCKDDGTLWYYEIGGKPTHIADGVVTLQTGGEDLSVLYYVTEDGTLYKRLLGRESQKIAADVLSTVLYPQPDGTVYYGKASGVKVSDFVIDDLPESSPYLPTLPLREDYATDEEYEQAYALYWDAYVAYYRPMQLRLALENYETAWQICDLYYYDGNTSEPLLSTVFSYTTASDDGRVYVMPCLRTEQIESVALSSVQNEAQLSNALANRFLEAAEQYVVVDGKAVRAQVLDGADSVILSADGRKVVFGTTKDTGDAWSVTSYIRFATIENGRVLSPTDIGWVDGYLSDALTLDDGTLLYTAGEILYADTVSIDHGAIDLTEIGPDGKTVLYAVEDGSVSVLKSYRPGEEPQTIAEDVNGAMFIGNKGAVIFLGDFDPYVELGTLYRYQNGKTTVLDEEVEELETVYVSTAYSPFHGS